MKVLVILGISVACLAPRQNDSSSPSSATGQLAASRIEGFSEEARIVLATNYLLKLDPGVSAKKTQDTTVLSTYDGRRIRVDAGSERITLPSPVTARVTPAGWDLGMGKTYSIAALHISRDEQDDTDSNLKSMQESAKKLKSKADNKQDNDKASTRKLRVRWLYGENPNPTAELFNDSAIQQLTHVSPIGF